MCVKDVFELKKGIGAMTVTGASMDEPNLDIN